MAVSKKQQASVNKYIKNNYDRINIVVPKGKREQLKGHAASMGESLNSFVARATDEQIKRDTGYKIDISETIPAETLEGIRAALVEQTGKEWSGEVNFTVSVNEEVSPESRALLLERIAECLEDNTKKAAAPSDQDGEAE